MKMFLEPGYCVSHAIKLNRLKGYLYRNSLETIAFLYVTKPLPADAGRFSAVLLDILKDDVVGDIAAGRAEIAACPEVPSPVALLEPGEFSLNFVRRSALHPANNIANPKMRRDRHEHMHMIRRQDALDDGHAELGADLADDLADTQAHFACQNLEAILGDPDDVVAMIKNGVRAGVVGHAGLLGIMDPYRLPAGSMIPRRPACRDSPSC